MATDETRECTQIVVKETTFCESTLLYMTSCFGTSTPRRAFSKYSLRMLSTRLPSTGPPQNHGQNDALRDKLLQRSSHVAKTPERAQRERTETLPKPPSEKRSQNREKITKKFNKGQPRHGAAEQDHQDRLEREIELSQRLAHIAKLVRENKHGPSYVGSKQTLIKL